MARTVLYVHSSAGRYGADRQLLALAAGLDPKRYRALAVLPGPGPLAEDLRAEGIEVIVRPQLAVLRRALFTPWGLARVAGQLARDRTALGRLAREREAVLVHANTSVCVGAYSAAAGARLPLAVSVREIYADFARWWPLYRRFLLRADALACSSEPVRAQFRGSPRARVLHEGVTAAAQRAPRARGARRPRPPGGSVRLRRARPPVFVEGPGDPRARPRPGRTRERRGSRARGR